MQTIYRPGQWYLIVIPGALVALPPDAPGELVTKLWERLPQQKTLATVVDVLTTHAGGSFTALPPFAAAVAEGDDVRIALRGGVAARVSDDDDAAHEFTGAEVTTWSERFVGRASRVEITVEETDAVSGLPVHSGVVRAAAVSSDLEASDAEPLLGAQGPAPLVQPDAAGVSAAVLAGTTAPQLASFGGRAAGVASTPAASADAAPASAAAPVAGAAGAVAAPPLVVPGAVPPPAAAESAGEEPASADPAPAIAETDAAVAAVAASEAPAPAPGPDAADETDEADETDAADDRGSDDSRPVTEETLAPAADDEFDQLFGETVHLSSAPAAPAPASAPVEGDHDGATISAAELRALRQQAPEASSEAPTQVIPVQAGATGRIRVSTGQVVNLDRTVIIGRRPRSTRASGASMPHLVAVDSPQQDISRSHLEVRPEGDTVVVIDLHTTNGSTLLRPGADPVRLHPGEQTLVLSGDVVDLGDGVTVAFEDLP
ncbi:FHA domain containing protein [Microbacterium sp. HM58-2]|nr:FHA domain containing protein [Microbacterium sp. HM58-2]